MLEMTAGEFDSLIFLLGGTTQSKRGISYQIDKCLIEFHQIVSVGDRFAKIFYFFEATHIISLPPRIVSAPNTKKVDDN